MNIENVTEDDVEDEEPDSNSNWYPVIAVKFVISLYVCRGNWYSAIAFMDF